MSPTRFRQLWHRLTDDDVRGALEGDSAGPAGGRSAAGANGRQSAGGAAAAGRSLSHTAGEGDMEDEEGDGGESEAARKQFWQRFLVAGLPGKPQLLAQSVSSGACSSVGSSTFLSRCAMGPRERERGRRGVVRTTSCMCRYLQEFPCLWNCL